MKRKVNLLLMAILLPFFNSTAQDTSFCGHNIMKEANPEWSKTSQSIAHGTKRFREKNPNLHFYPKPMPAPPCSTCMTIDPSCFKLSMPCLLLCILLQNKMIPLSDKIAIFPMHRCTMPLPT